MRNLRCIHRSLLDVPEGTQVTGSTWDAANDSVVCVFGPTKESPLVELKRWHEADRGCQSIAAWDAEACPLPDCESDEVIDIHYFSDTSTTCIVFAGGDLVLVREDLKDDEDKIEIVGSVDAGVRAAAWSPDEELLAIITRADTLLYMTQSLENITEILLTTEDLKVSQHVSVGWGRKETQFKGKSARILRDPTVPEVMDKGSLTAFDDGNTTISWRGDAAYLAVNDIIKYEDVQRRVIRVYSRDGVLDSVSEPVDCQEGALSWRPAGNLIASVQRLEELLTIVFFEKNGLRHGSFNLRLSREEMSSWGCTVSLKWNVDSSVLAVLFADRVQLWTMGNYHYYLKQEILCPSTGSQTDKTSLTWHPEKPLHCILHDQGCVRRLTYASVISTHPTSPPNDYGSLAVIDGKTLHLTPLRLANIPPPMAVHSLSLSANIIDVATDFWNDSQPSVVLAILHQDGVSIFVWQVKSMLKDEPMLLSHHVVPTDVTSVGQDSSMNLQITSVNSTSVAVLQHRKGLSLVHLISMQGSNDIGKQRVFHTSKNVENIVHHGPNEKNCLLLITERKSGGDAQNQTQSELVHCFPSENGAAPVDVLFTSTLGPRIEAVSWLGRHLHREVISSVATQDTTSPPSVFSLAENGSLFINERCLVKNCTSYLVTSTHLIFTTSQHLLKFVHLEQDQDLDIPSDIPESDERCRSVERGARLVTVMPTIFALVLQMPRGNLETIYPRALVLAGIRDSVNKKKYRKAFLACRSQRVDMNILHDHAPAQFLSNVGLFIDQLEKSEYIDLFLSQLRDEDVAKTIYHQTSKPMIYSDRTGDRPQEAPTTRETEANKVNQICDAFLDALNERPAHSQCMISAYVCKQPPDLEAGLSRIAEMRNQKSDKVDAMVEHICFLADINRLFDGALGIYDLQLTLLIAQQSQKDPREYLPFLRGFQAMPALRRRYSIDDHLKRYRKAISSLYEMDVFDEVKSYVKRHSLYTEALEQYRYQEPRLSELMRLYAEHLEATGAVRDAAIAYDYLNEYSRASSLYRQAHLWKESLSCANLIPLPETDLRSLATVLATSSAESRDYFSAASIHVDYLADIPNAATLFCKGYFFSDAIRIVALHRRHELLESVIDTGLAEGLSTMTELIAECKAQLNAQIPRIRELRAKKESDPLAFFDGEGTAGDGDIPDNVSIAPTDASTAGGGSLFTRYTNRSSGTLATNATRRSSKNRRREERKRARGKKGSVYEEEYLVASVRRLIERINTVGDEVERLAIGLTRRGMRERARAIEVGMVELIGICQACVGEIFGAGSDSVRKPVEAGEHIENSAGLGMPWDLLGSGVRIEHPPMIRSFEKLSLLGHQKQ